MTLLKKIGNVILKGLELATGNPMLMQLATAGAAALGPKVESELNQLFAIITSVEVVGQVLSTPGADKLKAATPLVAQVILASDLMTKHKIANAELFKEACQGYADATAKLLNSLEDKVDTVSKTA